MNEKRDVLLWVGREFYPSMDDFVDEATTLGCCRRVPRIPFDLTLGETRIYLLHRAGTGEHGYLFGYYILDGLIQCSLQQEVTDELRRGMPLTAIGATARSQMPERGCGGIDPPALYLVGPEDITMQKGFRPDTGRRGKIYVFDHPLSVGDLKHWRGYRLLTWDDITQLLTGEMLSHI